MLSALHSFFVCFCFLTFERVELSSVPKRPSPRFSAISL